MVVPVDTSTPSLRAETPRLLFESASNFGSGSTRSYDIFPDGQHFILGLHDEVVLPITNLQVILNWPEELKRRGTAKQ